MEQFHFKQPHFSLRGIFTAIANPDFMWRIMLSAVAILTTIISVISFFSYLWASHSAPAVTAIKKDRNVVTRQEINSALVLYQGKQARFKVLIERRPQAPNLGGTHGVEGDISAVPLELVNEGIVVVPTP